MRLEDGFLRWATSDPDLPAVVSGHDRRSYGQLHQQAAALAETIAEIAGPDLARVGIFCERGPDAYAAILASLLAGAAYVPVNPGHPPARIARTIELADLDLILADDAGMAGLANLTEGLPANDTMDRWRPTVPAPFAHLSGSGRDGAIRLVGTGPRPRPSRPATGHRPGSTEDVAYLLFTSGTTGDPKGVPITHANVTAFLGHNLEHYRFGPGDRCSQTFDLTFDLSVFDLFMAWGSGACLHTMGAKDLLAPIDYVCEHGLSVWFSVPAVAALQLQRRALRPGVMPSLRTSLFCGEALTVEVADAWTEAAPNSMAENLYGPTELTIACTRHRFSPIGGRGPTSDLTGTTDTGPVGGLVPIGRPFPTMTAVVVDEGGHPVEDGQEGELCLQGPQMFGGYWRSPERTAERIIEIDGIDHYRTGDRVVAEQSVPHPAAGEPTFHFVGRLDGQVQVLGHRVELGEVEAAARTLAGVVDAVAVPLPLDGTTVTALGLAVTLAAGADTEPRSLRRSIAPLLPTYMAPRRVVVLDRFPLNANGKIDRGAVAEQAFGRTLTTPITTPIAAGVGATGAGAEASDR